MSKPLPRYRQDTDPTKVDRAISQARDTDTQPVGKQIGHRSGEGDQKRMRLIPVIAAGVPGTIPLTEGYAALAHKERIAKRFTHHRINRA